MGSRSLAMMLPRRPLKCLSDGKVLSLAGNSMHLRVLGSVVLFTLAFSMDVSGEDCIAPQSDNEI